MSFGSADWFVHRPRRGAIGRCAWLAFASWLLGGRLPNIGPAVRDGGAATPGRRIVEGRINYVIDGRSMAPYGAFRPAWPAPFAAALRLETGDVHTTPAVANADGAFRWLLEPGAYVVTRIGVGTFTDDTYIAWPRVVLCVRSGGQAPVYAGHLRLEGARYDEELRLSSGTVSRSRGIRYTMKVLDEAAARSGAEVGLMQVRDDLPIGDALQAAWQADRAGLIARACPRSR